MSHFSVLVIVGKSRPKDPEAAVEPLLAPYDEDGTWLRKAGRKGRKIRPASKWDWWQIGGRWTGELDGYEPDKDPANVKTCWVCGGTGTRTDMAVANGCNGCSGTGKRVEWPTQWKEHGGDVMRVRDIRKEFEPYAVVLPDGKWLDSGDMGWFGIKRNETMSDRQWSEAWEKLRKENGGLYAVLVDCHV